MIVSRETSLAAYRALLLRWDAAISLSSRGESSPGGFERNIADSLSLCPHLPAGLDRLIDLGSGQGFPAIPVAIQTGVAVEMVESDRRKAAFLTTALAQLALRGRVWPVRIEQCPAEPAACVTARALAPLGKLLTLARALLQPGGVCLFFKGPNAGDEIQVARQTHSFDAEILPASSHRSCLVKITALR